MPFLLATPVAEAAVATTARVAIPKLVKYLAKNGGDKLIKKYGQNAFEAVLGTTAGVAAYNKTAEKVSGYVDSIGKDTESTSSIPKGSMEGVDRMKQMDAVMAVPNVNKSVRETGQGLVIGGEAKEILPPPEPFSTPIDSQTATILSTPIPEKVDTTLSTPIPEKIDTKESFPDQSGELSKPIVYYNKDDSPDATLEDYLKENNKKYKESLEKRNKRFPELSITNNKKIVEADNLFGAAALTHDTYNEAYLKYMTPDEYLNLTPEFNKDSENAQAKIKNLEKVIKDDKELANVPLLYVDVEGKNFVVNGHEGRHRVVALKNLGYDKIPVIVEGYSTNSKGEKNRLYTATPKSYLYNSEQSEGKRDFIPEKIISWKDTFSIDTVAGDFYSVRTKEKLFVKDDVSDQTDKLVRGIGDNNPPSSIEEEPTESKSFTTQNFLNDDLMNDLLKIRGGIEGFKKNMASEFPKMPASTKNFMEQELQKKLFDKYKLDKYPEGESPETVNEFRKKYLEDTYFKNLGAIEYITSVAYDVIDEKPKDSILVVDEDGLPIAAAKISLPGRKDIINVSDVYHKDALVIVEAGSIFKNAGDQLFNDIIQKAKDEGRRFVIAEDLTSPEALRAMEKRGFKTPTKKDTKKFKGQKIRRPNGRTAYQKNLVLDLGIPEKKALGGLIDKPLLGRSRDI